MYLYRLSRPAVSTRCTRVNVDVTERLQVSCGEQRSVEDAVGASGWELEAMKCPLLRWETDVEGTGGMFKTCGRTVLGRGEGSGELC